MTTCTQSTLHSYKVKYHTFGCKLNFAETASLENALSARGMERVRTGESPDIIVVNTCSVTELADKKCRQTIRSYARRHPEAAIVVTGCYAQLKPQEAASLPGVVIVAGADQKGRLPEMIAQWTEQHSQRMEVSALADIREFTPSCSRGDRTRYFLKVQDGCNYYCSYCTIPMARGRSRSGSIDSIVAQARAAAAEGGKEIVITGVNIGHFGYGRSDTLLDLIRELDGVEGIERFRISSIEPDLLTDSMIEWVAQSRRFMPHFHIPLQAGADEVLSLMRRRYDTALFRHKVEMIRDLMPHAFIGVDLIAGSRGETLELFDQGYRFVDSLPISRLHVFPYSERPGTRAVAEISHVVPQDEKHRRAKQMIELSDCKQREFSEAFIGSVRPVLVEHTRHANGTMSGFTDNYLKVNIPSNPDLANKVVMVRLDGMDGLDMKGTVI
ncbi:MAG: tRNA (N(6)-L-threonylcarbamoyladenosine(37)-C(2))-methylthiotransferase MtaB [Bacteroides sp.]|nr:tRNA (N(6)-L-threonylcarbamoyladenosine(37)-C(2))-methylthiotransferase MtaB [Bacteroides sp.]